MSDKKSQAVPGWVGQLPIVAAFMKGLHLYGIILLLGLLFGSIAAYGLFETRSEWLPMIYKSQTAAVIGLMLLTSLISGSVGYAAQAKSQQILHSYYERSEALMLERIQEVRTQLDECRMRELENLRCISQLKGELLAVQLELRDLRVRRRSGDSTHGP